MVVEWHHVACLCVDWIKIQIFQKKKAFLPLRTPKNPCESYLLHPNQWLLLETYLYQTWNFREYQKHMDFVKI